MKKVLIVADTYFPKIDGVMHFLQELIPRLRNYLDITLLVPDYGITRYNEVRLKLSRIIRLSGYKSIRPSISNFLKIRRAVKEADTLFVQGPGLASIFSIYFGRLYRKKVIYYTHFVLWELYSKNLPLKAFTPFLRWLTINYWYNFCNLLVLPYRSLRKDLEELGVDIHMEVARLGVNTDYFTPSPKDEAKKKLGIDPRYIVIGFVGRISKEKNISVLIEAFKRIEEHARVKLLIVGNGTKHAMKQFDGVRNVILAGFQKNVPPYLQAMDIFVMPSLTETTSLATLEAMACGIPVITTKVGFLKEYVIKNHNGLLFPKGNSYSLLLQLRKMLRHRELREEMGINARQTALSFSWEKTAMRIKDILERN